ncbi:hypothetical protein E2C11_22080 [Streptomyces lavendulae]|uniref:hypothetical protein n=1 Tax=Streptomyces sp. SUK 48 TaxID=2582831 RepID=UPI0011CDA3D4|nr:MULTISPECIES: hypothetical protein [Streptomyces]TXJ76453.1 hypothetical protein E2C11_22080 [Streptomyces lavendulae]
MVRRGAVPRGLRFGIRVGVIPAAFWGVLFLVLTVASARYGPLAVLGRGLIVVVGSLGVGALLGVATGAVLAVAPDWLVSRGPLRGVLAAVVAGGLFQAEVVLVLVAMYGGYGQTLLAFLATPAVAVAAAAHSGDIAGRSRRHPWLWSPGTVRTLIDLASSPGSWESKGRRLLRMLW